MEYVVRCSESCKIDKKELKDTKGKIDSSKVRCHEIKTLLVDGLKHL